MLERENEASKITPDKVAARSKEGATLLELNDSLDIITGYGSEVTIAVGSFLINIKNAESLIKVGCLSPAAATITIDGDQERFDMKCGALIWIQPVLNRYSHEACEDGLEANRPIRQPWIPPEPSEGENDPVSAADLLNSGVVGNSDE